MATKSNKGVGEVFAPIRGFVSEFSPTRFPTEAAIDLSNVEIEKDGSIRRRPGLDAESSYVATVPVTGYITLAEANQLEFSSYLWRDVGGNGGENIAVIQTGLVLFLYRYETNISSNLITQINLTPYCTNATSQKSLRVDMAAGAGSLFVTGPFLKPIYLTYSAGAVTVTELVVKVRDFDGYPLPYTNEDYTRYDYRPLNMNGIRYYNLRNKGWTAYNISVHGGLSGWYLTDPEAAWINVINIGQIASLNADVNYRYPSEADIMYLGITLNTDGDSVYSPTELINANVFGDTPAPTGHFLLDPFNKDYNGVLGSADVDLITKTTQQRPSAVAFHNGRVFYAVPAIDTTPAGIYYSQLLTDVEKAGNWFQSADPTAETINQVVATDGGFIPVPGTGDIYALVELGSGVVIGASNGVWYLTGGDTDIGFSAVSNRVVKLSASGLLGADSFVVLGNSAAYFSDEGIMVVGLDQNGLPQERNLSRELIQTFYNNISPSGKANAAGVYVAATGKIYWAYSSASETATSSKSFYDSLLVYDTAIGGFYKHTLSTDIDNNWPIVCGILSSATVNLYNPLEEVTLSDGTVVTLTDTNDVVQVNPTATALRPSAIKFITLAYIPAGTGYAVTVAEFNDITFHDWATLDPVNNPKTGINYSSYIEYGYNTMGGNHMRGAANYVYSYFATQSKNLAVGGYYGVG